MLGEQPRWQKKEEHVIALRKKGSGREKGKGELHCHTAEGLSLRNFK